MVANFSEREQPLPADQQIECGVSAPRSEYFRQFLQQQCRGSHMPVASQSSEQQQRYTQAPSVLSQPPGYQSSVNFPPSGYQQFPISNSLGSQAPRPPPRPEQLYAQENLNTGRVPAQQNVFNRIHADHVTGPTAQQLAARQEWPLFFSSFRNSTEACGYNDAENLARLQRCLRGHALESVRSRLLIPESVPQVITSLERLYGRPEVVINSLLKRMREIPSPRGDDLKTLIKFGMGVGNLVEHMIMANQRQHVSNPMLLQEMVDRLPPNLKLQWASFKRSYHTVDLEAFNNFMTELVTMASEVVLVVDPVQQSSTKSDKNRRENAKERLFVHQQAHLTSDSGANRSQQMYASKLCSHCNQKDHRIAECQKFKNLNLDDKWKAVKQKGLCRMCLIPHRTWPCRSKQECGIEGCRLRHNSLLHSGNNVSSMPSVPTSTHRNIAHQHHHSMTSSAILRYIPVTLYGNGKSLDIYAFLDDGSSTTMLEAEVVSLMGVEGPKEPLCLCWTGDVVRMEKESQRVEFAIAGKNDRKHFPLKARTVGQLKLPSQTVARNLPILYELYEHHPYLKKIPLSSYTQVTPKLIIGVDNAQLISALKSRESGQGGLITVKKTRLGWCLYGRHAAHGKFVENVNVHVERCEHDIELHDLFRQFLAIDEANIQQSMSSEEDKRALRILQETTRKVDGKLETGLLWRYDEPCLPNSYPMAVRRMEALERKLSKDSHLHHKVHQLVAEYIDKGYAHRIKPEELKFIEPSRVWYLPLGVMSNPRKPGKIRLIWDAAARVDGVSFNDMMLKGPDMLTALPTVLLRFRQKRVAFSGDIREMFHQFLIRSNDKQMQRVVFREQRGQPPQIFVMDVATFGAACSPCIAQYLKNKNAEEYAEQFPEAARAIVENHYVDDYLDSVDSVEEAVKLIQEVKYVHSMAGMEISKRQEIY
ncbi:uncharacterized protein LOC129728541 [Wyeomyia smithii]|uniref:uncharacterized protein LOC129728541 n=1 Tax=Wyeomyia smithii TaxID=174621 RepID=UPI002467EAF6|nr:uncharacterized protein LOC129728541 [Wyeomyia smithii]